MHRDLKPDNLGFCGSELKLVSQLLPTGKNSRVVCMYCVLCVMYVSCSLCLCMNVCSCMHA